MKNNNNPWLQLCNPVDDRPGTPRTNPPPEHVAMPKHEIDKAHAKVPDNPWGLTERRVRILDMMVQGMSTAEIARTLGLSVSTVAQHTVMIRTRMEVATNGQAVLAWHRHYRVLQPDKSVVDKDDILINNLELAIVAQRAYTNKGKDMDETMVRLFEPRMVHIGDMNDLRRLVHDYNETQGMACAGMRMDPYTPCNGKHGKLCMQCPRKKGLSLNATELVG